MANRLILASSSPRRLDLLQLVGIHPTVSAADIDETALIGENGEELVLRLSALKAQKVATEEAPKGPCVVIGADTVVRLSGEILNKPTDEAEARRMLQGLSGNTHEVLTGVSVVSGETTVSEVVHSLVEIRTLSEAEIDDYISSGEPFGKAGSYAIQGYGAVFVTRIEGSYHNVVGLPLHCLDSLMTKVDQPLKDWVNTGGAASS